MKAGISAVNKKLLIVDDQAGMARAIRAVAETVGFDCMTVNRAEEAIGAFLSFRPDVLILDIVMPETDGLDVLNDVLLTEIPSRIILTSGYGGSMLLLGEALAQFHRRGPIDILPKPFRREELVELLTKA